MARWTQNGVTVAGDHAAGDARNQLSYPEGLYVDEDNTVFVADSEDNRIIEWKLDERSGQVLIGGDVQGNQPHRLNFPVGVIVDKANDSLIIDDRGNRRVIRCSRSNGTGRGETIIEDIDCSGLAMDDEGSLYISDVVNHEVRRYRKGETRGGWWKWARCWSPSAPRTVLRLCRC